MKLELSNISKIYNNGHQALDDFSLTLSTGVTGLLGPNGAGKSTLMRIIATITRPSAGSVFLDGIDIAKKPDTIRNILGYLPQDFGVYPSLTVRQYLEYIGALKGIQTALLRERIEQIIELVNLSYVDRKRKLSQYSGGMRQRVGIAQALLNDPKILIVDEPTVGLDPQERNRFARLLTEMSENRIIILSTHIVSDIEATAERVAVIKQGRKVAYGRPEEIIQSIEGQVFTDILSAEQYRQLQAGYLISATKRQLDGVHVRFIKTPDQRPFNNSDPVPPTLEEAYLCHVGI